MFTSARRLRKTVLLVYRCMWKRGSNDRQTETGKKGEREKKKLPVRAVSARLSGGGWPTLLLWNALHPVLHERTSSLLASERTAVSCADGAALVYTSAKDGVNCSVLHRYLLSCVYPDAFSFSEEGQVCTAARCSGRVWCVFAPWSSSAVVLAESGSNSLCALDWQGGRSPP